MKWSKSALLSLDEAMCNSKWISDIPTVIICVIWVFRYIPQLIKSLKTTSVRTVETDLKKWVKNPKLGTVTILNHSN